MKLKLNGLWIAVLLGLGLQSCHNKSIKTDRLGRFTNDSAKIAADEAFKPIVEDELLVLKALNKKLQPRMIYTPENQVINLLLTDSVRVALLSRKLTADELSTLSQRTLSPTMDRFAIDAVALIVNKSSADTTFTVSGIKNMLAGKAQTDKKIIFDNPNSGMVKYLKDFSGSKDLTQKNVFSMKSNKEVIQYVSGHPDAIGIIDFSWLYEPDKDYAAAAENVKVAVINDDANKKLAGKFFAPSQTTIALNQYPLMRSLYIINCTGSSSLGKKVADFFKSERGQLIVLKSGLLPDDIPEPADRNYKKIKQ